MTHEVRSFRLSPPLDPPNPAERVECPFLATLWPFKSTAAQRRCVLRLVATATDEKIAIAPLLARWAECERGLHVYRLRRFVRLLNQGVFLADAAEQVSGLFSDDEVLSLRLGSQSGTLAASTRAQLFEAEDVSAARVKIHQTLRYLGVLVFVGIPIVTFYCLKIWPAFYQIFEEFGIEVNSFFDLATSINLALSQLGWVFPIALYLGIWSALSRTPGRLTRTYVLNPLLKPLRDLRSARMLTHLAETIGAGRPVLSAVSTLARYHYDPRARQQLLIARNDVEQGAQLWPSLFSRRVLTDAELNALATCEPLGNEAWMLHRLAAQKRSRALAWCEIAAGWILPVAVLTLGVFVLIQALAVFGSLDRLIWGLR